MVHRAFAKAASLLLDRTLYYMNRRLWVTVSNTFAGLWLRLWNPADASRVSGSRSAQISNLAELYYTT